MISFQIYKSTMYSVELLNGTSTNVAIKPFWKHRTLCYSTNLQFSVVFWLSNAKINLEILSISTLLDLAISHVTDGYELYSRCYSDSVQTNDENHFSFGHSSLWRLRQIDNAKLKSTGLSLHRRGLDYPNIIKSIISVKLAVDKL